MNQSSSQDLELDTMASAPISNDYRKAAQSFLDDGQFSDFTIICAGKEYKVLRVTLAAHSEFFDTCCSGGCQEATIELQEDNPKAVELMLRYMYGFDYSDQVKPDAEGGFTSALDLNIGVYAISDKYEIPDLSSLALRKLWRGAAILYSDADAMVSSVRVACALQGGRAMGDIQTLMVNAWLIGGEALHTAVGDKGYHDLVSDMPRFAVELTCRLMCGFTKAGSRATKRCSDCISWTNHDKSGILAGEPMFCVARGAPSQRHVYLSSMVAVPQYT